MGRRTTYAPGTFSWVDLASPDASAAAAFYGALFGWELEETDAGGGAVYTVCRLDGDAVCGLYEAPVEARATDEPSRWTNYVTVDDADAAAARARELGGQVLSEPFDVVDAGRMALLGDNQGAAFAVWQPRARIGAERVNDVGCLCMNELTTDDLDGTRAFYGGLFGWTFGAGDPAAAGPALVFNGDNINAAVFAAPPGTPAYWRPCFTVESTRQAVRRVRELGGEQLLEPVELDHGSIAMVHDPQGAVFTLFAGETHP